MQKHVQIASFQDVPKARHRRELITGLLSSLKQCNKTGNLETGKALHSYAIQYGFHTNKYIANALISMYAKCGSVRAARDVFESMLNRDVVSWTNLILGYVENGECLVALHLFETIDCEPDSLAFVAALKACTRLASVEKGMCIHIQVKERGMDTYVPLANTLLDMYTKCGSMHLAQATFDSMSSCDVVSWNILILGYVEDGQSHVALEFFMKMDCEPSVVTYVAALKACVNIQDGLERGMVIHKLMKDTGYLTERKLGNALVDMYSKCGSMRDAQEVFDNMMYHDVISWTSLIQGYMENGESLTAMSLFTSMNCEPNYITFIAALKACTALKDSKLCSWIHIKVKRYAYDEDIFVENVLVDMYSKCGCIHHARDVFDNMLHPDVVSWTSLILGYAETGESSVAMELFINMDCTPNSVTYVAVLKSCALSDGKALHAHIHRLGIEQDSLIETTSVDFYGKCGSMYIAEHVFNTMHSPNMVSWTSLITGYTSNTSEVFKLIREMQERGVHMDEITYTSVLAACTHTGQVEKGKAYFESMSRYGITPTKEHYTCLVDMLGRANRLQEALDTVYSMPFEADHVVWTALLGACKNCKNMEIGKLAYDALVACEYKDPAAYILMSDMQKTLGI